MESLVEILNQFGVQWPKFLAQVILFLIVYLVLAKFAFKPVVNMLEERRARIEKAERDVEEMKERIAEAEHKYQEILEKANAEAQKLVNQAKESGDALAERKKQEAILEAERIVARAQEAMELEHDKMSSELRRDLGRLVVDTTAKVTGKVLTPEDQKRISEEAARQAAA